MRIHILPLLLLGHMALAVAQTAAPVEFAPDAVLLANDALHARMADKVFRTKFADGNSWRLEYQSNGYYYVNGGPGFKGSGKWRVDDGRLCTELNRSPVSCNEMRATAGLLYLKRDSGEVIVLTPQ